jgi:branched-chain amino acid transport system ATP-binding protein
MAEILRIENLTRRFGGVVAVNDVSLALQPGEIVGLIGPNGAGKTTLVNLVTGFIPKTAGRVLFHDRDISGLAPHRIAQLGIARTFQIVQPFAEMTVLENVMAGALFAGDRASIKAATEKAHHYLAFTGLASHTNYRASELSLANRKRMELAKSLAMEPRLLFLDEVNAGLNTSELDSALDLIRKIAAGGVTIVIIEHLMKIILSVVGRIVVLHHGAKLSEGLPTEVMNDPAVVKAYIGTKFAQRFQKDIDAGAAQQGRTAAQDMGNE